jgi:uncharacterized protein
MVGVGVLMFWLGRLPPSVIGLRSDRIFSGAVMTILVWLAVQSAAVVLALLGGGSLQLHPAWGGIGGLGLFGALVVQVVGVTVYEEVAFRGYLVPQLWLRARRGRWFQRRGALVVALLVSQALFAIGHLPLLLYTGVPSADLGFVLIAIGMAGLGFAGLYLLTGNLFFCMGVHALVNLPTPLFDQPAAPLWALIAIASYAIGLASRARRRASVPLLR